MTTTMTMTGEQSAAAGFEEVKVKLGLAQSKSSQLESEVSTLTKKVSWWCVVAVWTERFKSSQSSLFFIFYFSISAFSGSFFFLLPFSSFLAVSFLFICFYSIGCFVLVCDFCVCARYFIYLFILWCFLLRSFLSRPTPPYPARPILLKYFGFSPCRVDGYDLKCYVTLRLVVLAVYICFKPSEVDPRLLPSLLPPLLPFPLPFLLPFPLPFPLSFLPPLFSPFLPFSLSPPFPPSQIPSRQRSGLKYCRP